jgi:ADP-ribosylglycohydrolase
VKEHSKEAIHLAVSLGGDADALAAIAGSVAERPRAPAGGVPRSN